jgi:putative flippase GtrA
MPARSAISSLILIRLAERYGASRTQLLRIVAASCGDTIQPVTLFTAHVADAASVGLRRYSFAPRPSRPWGTLPACPPTLAASATCSSEQREKSYKIGLELLVKAGCRKIAEIPISFRDRLHGHSKLTLTEQINYLRHLLRLYKFKLGRAFCPLQFVLVGGTGMMVDVAAFMMLLHFVPLIASWAMAIGTAMTWNFLLNRRFTFSEARQQPILAQYFLFCLLCLIGGMMNWTVSVRLCSTFAFFDRWKLLAALCGVVAGTTFNYVLSSRVVFAKPDNEPL